MKHYILPLLCTACYTLGAQESQAPSVRRKDPLKSALTKGIRFESPDTSYSVKMGFRFQNLMALEANSDNLEVIDARILTRRARLKFDGYVFAPNVKYKVELGLSNSDMGSPVPQGNHAPNIMYDAVIKWEFIPGTELWFGQTKLPGNRERVISSQALQFVDRSIVNSEYNLDRDVGFQLRNEFRLGKMVVRDIYALSMGEGRDITARNAGGVDHTARLEVLPFGSFTKRGDYVGSDIYRESSPKLSLAVSYDYNDEASKERGQLGDFIDGSSDLKTVFADMMFKYRGFSVMSEYVDKQASRPVLYDQGGDMIGAFVAGKGLSVQAGYLFKSNWEIAGRYSHLKPLKGIGMEQNWMYTLGISRYIVGHNLKCQADLSLTDVEYVTPHQLMFRFQTELAF